MLKKFFPDFEKPKQNFEIQPQQFVENGTGSGFFYDDQGHILTNNHVIDGADKILVTTHDGLQHTAKLVASDKDTDIAVIKVETTEYRPVKIGASKDLD